MALASRSCPARGPLLALAFSTCGCVTSLGGSAASNIDSNARLGTEERVEGAVGFGFGSPRGYVALAAGAGYLGALRRGYGMVAPEVGIEGGQSVRWSAGVFCAARVYGQPVQLLSAGGAAGQVLFRLPPDRADSTGVAIGPRLAVEGAQPPPIGAVPGSANVPIAIVQLGFVVRWINFDGTRARLE